MEIPQTHIENNRILKAVDDDDLVFQEKGLDKYSQYRITDTIEIEDPIPVISITGEIISTAGNITVISGQSKGGKSAFLSPIIAAAISSDGEIHDQYEGVEVLPNIKKYAVIHIDTEQARAKHFKNIKSIIKRSRLSKCPDHFLSYNFRGLEINDSIDILNEICTEANDMFGGIHLIVIDGIADFVNDPNDQSESNALIKLFEQISIKFSCPLITVVHTNPGSDKERGHLGSQLQRKAESVLLVSINGDISTLEPKLLRMAGKGKIPLIQFAYNAEKGYHIFHGYKEKSNKVSPSQNFDMWAKEIIPPPKSIRCMDFVRKLMIIAGRGEDSCKKYIKDMVELEIISKDDGLYRYNIK